jgi:hypothetical protein
MNDTREDGPVIPGPDSYVYGETPEAEESAPVSPGPDATAPDGPAVDGLPPLAAESTVPPAPVDYGPEIPDDEIEPPIVRHDPYATTRSDPWMDRALDAIGRVMVLVRRDLADFPILEGRDPKGADIDAMVDKHVAFLRPILRREQATDIAYDELEKMRSERIAKKREAVSMVLPAADLARVVGPQSAPSLGGAISRVAPIAGGIGAAAVTLLVPRNLDYGQTFALGKGIRARQGTGQRSIEIEREVPDVIGTKWARIPVDAERVSGPDGRTMLRVDAAQLEQVVGAEAAAEVLKQAGIVAGGRGTAMLSEVARIAAETTVPLVVEMHVASKEASRAIVTHREATKEEVERDCTRYSQFERIGQEAVKDAKKAGLNPGLLYGRKVHTQAGKELNRSLAKRLDEEGIHELNLDVALLEGKRFSYRPRGSSVPDVVEIRKDGTVCIYDYKTGGSPFTADKMEQYLREVETYVTIQKYGYTRIIVMPIRLD